MATSSVLPITVQQDGPGHPSGKLWLRIFFPGFIVISLLLIITLRTLPFYGDMTRLGLLSETAFGWHVQPPHVEPRYLQAAPVSEADVMVIGDSFSMSNRWQSLLVRSGYKVSTTFFGQYKEELCRDFDGWLDRAGFQGKLVIIESVERLLNDRLKNGETCEAMSRPLSAGLKPFFPPLDEVPPPALNWDGKLLSGVQIFSNTRSALKSTEPWLSNKKVLVRSVPDGCALFSHQACTKLPLWPDDDANGELTPHNVAQMKAFTDAHPRRKLLWMVIPNKTTVYIKPENSKDFVADLVKQDLGPDLFSFGLAQKTQMRDFFFPNDTHISMQGQLALGQRMLEAVRKIFPPPPLKSS